MVVQKLADQTHHHANQSAEVILQNKDKQEAAIYTFTIVTIIFLPISTVATILGMNTRDVRNMEKTQWVFWAAALPVTAVVIVGSLFAAGIFVWPFRRVDGGRDVKPLLKLAARRESKRTRRRRSRRNRSSSSSSSGSSGTLLSD